MKKPLPDLRTDDAAEDFLDRADLSDYELRGLALTTFEFAPKSKQVNMRFSEQLLSAVKTKAAERGMSYQRFIRQALEAAVQGKQ